MIEYDFPQLTNINIVKEAIKGREEFIIKHDEINNILIVNYIVSFSDTFTYPNNFDDPIEKLYAAIRKECRGLEFDAITGNLITRKYHKFHNLNENPEHQLNSIDFTQKHWILDKLDGSMITLFHGKNGIEAHTKMGKTEVADKVTIFLNIHPEYKNIKKYCDSINCTPIFEWCSRKQRIVIDYPIDSLILTAIRHNITGKYHTYDSMCDIGEEHNIPVVKAYEVFSTNPKELLTFVENMQNAEGIVVRFESGHMIKIKTNEYVLIHKSLDRLRYEKDILELIIDDKLDDLIPVLNDTIKESLISYSENVLKNITEYADNLKNQVEQYKKIHDKKSFALNVMPNLSKSDSGMIFKIWNGSDPLSVVKKFVNDNCRTQNSVNAIRHIIKIDWSNGNNNNQN